MVIANTDISLGIDATIWANTDVMAQTLATNTAGVAATCHPFITAMTARGHGNMVSVAGSRGLPGRGAYCASKAVLISSLRGEMQPTGMKVVTLCPGYIGTPSTQKNKYPMPVLMRPCDCAAQAHQTIARGTSCRVIARQIGRVAKLLCVRSNALFDQLFTRLPETQEPLTPKQTANKAITQATKAALGKSHP